MKLLLVTFIAIFLSSCSTTANYKKQLDSWVGASEEKLIVAWGPPQNSHVLPSGAKVLEYTKSSDVKLGGYSVTTPQTTYSSGNASAYGTGGSAYGNYSGTSTTYVQKKTQVHNITLSCKTRFLINKSGIVTSHGMQGNNCTSMKPK